MKEIATDTIIGFVLVLWWALCAFLMAKAVGCSVDRAMLFVLAGIVSMDYVKQKRLQSRSATSTVEGSY